MATPNATFNLFTTRARREATVTWLFELLIGELRSLSKGASIGHARRVLERYARAIGYPLGVGGDVLVDLLTSEEAAKLRMDEINDLIIELSNDDARLDRLSACH